MFKTLFNALEKLEGKTAEAQWKWIEGHWDDHFDINQLDVWAQDNVIIDYVAKLYWKRME